MAKKKERPLVTSLHVKHPEMLARIQAAAKLRGESVSVFLLRTGDEVAIKVLGGNCPNCGAPMKKAKRAA